ncbi:hypothetical protein EJ06DRAFT_581357 [Trichodelitschia bisporula]|uniref:Cell wall mannoprotein PIR1-like C-terminal domain-containing protein n=1 Tax=Trichodelitschia bisporula TaxID=703511 RepID=A0A6G1HYS4_9PEZI|nr:hypothetical protein EJ06DRAFT_581357 [Trichodelitschia bisporula]
MTRAFLLAAAAGYALANPFPQGVYDKIAPKAPNPPGCRVDWDKTFGIAAIPVSADGGPPRGVAPATATVKINSVVAPSASAKPAIVESAPAPPKASASAAAKPAITAAPAAPAGPAVDGVDSTTTVRSTTTNTRTVTVRRTVSAASAAVVATPSAAVRVAGAMASVYLVKQIGDGQIQMPSKAARVEIARATGSVKKVGKRATEAADAVAAVGAVEVSQAGDALRVCTKDEPKHTLTLKLAGGVLKDGRGWTGYIADNHQFQFDDPPQHGAIITAGFCVGQNSSLALGGSYVFWQCRSGDFSNLYDTWIAPQCEPVHLQAVQLVSC